MSCRSRRSTLSLAECCSHRTECMFKLPRAKNPTAPSLSLRYSASKLLMDSTFPGIGGRYQQHTRYGPRSECTMAQMRYATSDLSTSVIRAAYSSSTNTNSTSQLAFSIAPSKQLISFQFDVCNCLTRECFVQCDEETLFLHTAQQCSSFCDMKQLASQVEVQHFQTILAAFNYAFPKFHSWLSAASPS